MRPLLPSLAGAGCALYLHAACAFAAAALPPTHPLPDIEARASERLRERVGADPSATVEVTPLDRRLRLAACASALEARDVGSSVPWGVATVEVSCPDPPAWRVRVRGRITVTRDAWTLARAVRRGDVLQPDMLVAGTVTLGADARGAGTRGGEPLSDPAAHAGHEFVRPLRAGATLDGGDLRAPVLVHRGRQVRLTSAGDTLRVETRGVALADGRIGELVGVRNPRSGRQIDALVVGPDEARVR